MTAVKKQTITSDHKQDVLLLSQKIIERPVKLADELNLPTRTVIPLLLHKRLYSEYTSGHREKKQREKWMQAFGVVIIGFASWGIGLSLYAQL